MPKRSNTSVLEDLFEIAALLPWWVAVTLAGAAYGLLHHYAVAEVSTSAAPGQVGQMIGSQLTKMLASFGQYLLPLPLLAGAAASFLGRRKREGLIRGVVGGKSEDALRGMSWRDFELLVGEAFRRRGFSAAETGGGGADGGVDLRLRKGGELFLVQCKLWRAYKVSVNVVRELFGVMAAQGATGGFVVTSGVFTADARAFAEGRNIELLDGPALTAMIEEGRAVDSVVTTADKEASRVESPAAAAPAGEPICPRCGSAMVQRTAKRGQHAGFAFWGCTEFPNCRGVRAIG